MRPHACCLLGHLPMAVSGEHHDPSARRPLPNLRDGPEPIHHWHRIVEDDDIRMNTFTLLHRFKAICRLKYLPRRILLQKLPELLPEEEAVIGDQYSSRHDGISMPVDLLWQEYCLGD